MRMKGGTGWEALKHNKQLGLGRGLRKPGTVCQHEVPTQLPVITSCRQYLQGLAASGTKGKGTDHFLCQHRDFTLQEEQRTHVRQPFWPTASIGRQLLPPPPRHNPNNDEVGVVVGICIFRLC